MLAQWIVGPSLSGKTHHLLEAFQAWVAAPRASSSQAFEVGAIYPRILVLSAIGDNRLVLTDRLTALTRSKIPFRATTPLGFFEEEVLLFWPLLVKKLGRAAQFPVRLRPENEQELAARLWRPQLDEAVGKTGIQAQKLVRRMLDIYQLAAFSETPLEEVATILYQGLGDDSVDLVLVPEVVAEMLMTWRSWCLDRGFLNYGILTELYGQHLLLDPYYQLQLPYRIQAIFADDVDEYPPVMRSVFQQVLTYGAKVVCTFNPKGGVRLGLGADPEVMREMAQDWEIMQLQPRSDCCSAIVGEQVLNLITTPLFLPPPIPDCIQTLQTNTRAQLLRQTATLIKDSVQSGKVRAQDIAIVAPGFDPISRYALTEMLTGQGIRVKNLNEQRPLTSVPIVRSLLTLLTLIYPSLGRLVSPDGVAEMLVVLSSYSYLQSQAQSQAQSYSQSQAQSYSQSQTQSYSQSQAQSYSQSQEQSYSQIDPVRSGLLVDHCFEPHPDRPRLLSSQVFPRWDRLGYDGMNAYEDLIAWITMQQEQLEARLITNPIVLLDRAIQKFFLGGAHLPFEQISSLRELLDTAQHYWEVAQRLSQSEQEVRPQSLVVRSFIQLLRSGAVNANPYPVQTIGQAQDAVMIATVFQYRLNRESHRWQFWFDAGGDRWLTGVDALFGSPLFLQSWSGRLWQPEDTRVMHEQRLGRIVQDLLERSGDRVFLCHSDLATSGQEQLGPLLSIVNAALPIQGVH